MGTAVQCVGGVETFSPLFFSNGGGDRGRSWFPSSAAVQINSMPTCKFINISVQWSGRCYIYMRPLYTPPPQTLMGEMSEAECMSDGIVKEFTPI
jgi:hypothetical protein